MRVDRIAKGKASMVENFAKELWKVSPKSRLHVEVAEAGVNTYEIVVSLLDADKKTIHRLEHFGSGDLFELKREAIETLVNRVLQTAKI